MAQRGTGFFDRKGQYFKTPEEATVSDLAGILGKIGDGESLAPGIAHTILQRSRRAGSCGWSLGRASQAPTAKTPRSRHESATFSGSASRIRRGASSSLNRRKTAPAVAAKPMCISQNCVIGIVSNQPPT